jgi:D-alanyl-lipoteichoic acid acyltransferase DltB (MBOAT superfamily)
MLFCEPIFFLFFSGYFFIHKVIPKNLVMFLVILGSLFFYGYWNPAYIPLPIALVTFTYWAGLKIEKTFNNQTRANLLSVFLVLLFCPLIFFKYLNFIIKNLSFFVSSLHNSNISITLPLGISFITFTLAAYLIDIHRGKFPVERNFLALLSSVVFFPHLIAGPIVRPSQLLPQLKRWKYGEHKI